jgi:SPX domain protein involved in polyphosphate accumulation
MGEMSNNFRYERKFSIPSYVSVKEMEHITRTNSYFFDEIYHERRVNNIYFDTELFKYYFDNVDGVSERLKVRIRWYGDPLGKIKRPKLELKIKEGVVGDKWSFNLPSFELTDRFDIHQYKSIVKRAELPASIMNIILHLQPTLFNSYSRRYFLSKNKKFRITLDYSIVYRDIKRHKNHFQKPTKKDMHNVLELKYGLDEDKNAQTISNQFPFRMSKNSKYVNGINQFNKFPQ